MSIYRYPGGKSRIAKNIIDFFGDSHSFAEPFVGGGSVFSEWLRRRHTFATPASLFINDINVGIFSFWKSVFNKRLRKELLGLVSEVKPSIESFDKWQGAKPKSIVERGFRSLFLNRTSFSGYSERPIGGKKQASRWGVGCRYNAKALVAEISTTAEMAKGVKIFVSNLDFREFIKTIDNQTAVYADPPYYVQGKRMYTHAFCDQDHCDLASLLLARPSCKWMLSYDDHSAIKGFYRGLAEIVTIGLSYTIQGRKQSWDKKNELIIVKHEDVDRARQVFHQFVR